MEISIWCGDSEWAADVDGLVDINRNLCLNLCFREHRLEDFSVTLTETSPMSVGLTDDNVTFSAVNSVVEAVHETAVYFAKVYKPWREIVEKGFCISQTKHPHTEHTSCFMPHNSPWHVSLTTCSVWRNIINRSDHVSQFPAEQRHATHPDTQQAQHYDLLRSLAVSHWPV